MPHKIVIEGSIFFATSIVLFPLFSVTIDENGIKTDILEEKVKENLSYKPREVGGNKPFWGMVYLIPVFHNPTGVCLSPGINLDMYAIIIVMIF